MRDWFEKIKGLENQILGHRRIFLEGNLKIFIQHILSMISVRTRKFFSSIFKMLLITSLISGTPCIFVLSIYILCFKIVINLYWEILKSSLFLENRPRTQNIFFLKMFNKLIVFWTFLIILDLDLNIEHCSTQVTCYKVTHNSHK